MSFGGPDGYRDCKNPACPSDGLYAQAGGHDKTNALKTNQIVNYKHMKGTFKITRIGIALLFCITESLFSQETDIFNINEQGYYEVPGLNVMAFQDFYPDGHQGGITVIQNGIRVLANGDVRLEAAPGQWSPIPQKGNRDIDLDNNEICTTLWYPDSLKNRKGFNPIDYPDLTFTYHVRIKPEGNSFRIYVDLDEPLPDKWYGKVGFNIELFPGFYFGKSYSSDRKTGIFPLQANGPISYDKEGKIYTEPLVTGQKLVIVPENGDERIEFYANGNEIQLIDGRGEHNNGFFIVRTLLKKGKLENAAELIITPSYEKNWIYKPVIHVSQVGYHPDQSKLAVVELDKKNQGLSEISLWRVSEKDGLIKIKSAVPEFFGRFLRYNYLIFDFSKIKTPGIYKIKYGDQFSNHFQIRTDIYDRHVWQPTLEYFLPVQMCHMRINDRYRVWHGLCHDDDALMAPVGINHFDGYKQGVSTLTKYKPFEHVPGLNKGGWHDAGDYDLRVESQANTTRRMAQMWELFGVSYDATSINQVNKLVEMHKPDSIPDILQQIEHGALTIVGGFKALGRLYRGIICPDLRQYTLLGDGSIMTDNLVYDPSLTENNKSADFSWKKDDRWVFTENNPRREIDVAACMANVHRALKNYNEDLAFDCLNLAVEIFQIHASTDHYSIIDLATELYLSTGDESYMNLIISKKELVINNIKSTGPAISRIISKIDDKEFIDEVTSSLEKYSLEINKKIQETPFGVEYKPNIWGAGWGIQRFGVNQYFLHKGFPDLFSAEPVFSSLNFILGVHPGMNTASFVSGVGSKSINVAYGINRADWSYIPGGSVSGTALIRPDLAELKIWPFFWQQTEYVMGGGATNFMFLVLAAQDLLK